MTFLISLFVVFFFVIFLVTLRPAPGRCFWGGRHPYKSVGIEKNEHVTFERFLLFGVSM